MIRSQLQTALDLAKPKKGVVVPHEVYTFRRGEQWFIVRSGPGYCNTHKVLEFDTEGLTQLQAKECKEESRP